MKNIVLLPLSLITIFGLNGMVEDPVGPIEYLKMGTFLQSTLANPTQAEVLPSAALLLAKLGLEGKLEDQISPQDCVKILDLVGHQKLDPKARYEALEAEGELLIEGKIGARTAAHIERAQRRLRRCTGQSDSPTAKARAHALLGLTNIEGALASNSYGSLLEAEAHLNIAKGQTADQWANALGTFGLARVHHARKEYKKAYKLFEASSKQEANPLIRDRSWACMGQMRANGQHGFRKRSAIPYLERVAKLEAPEVTDNLLPTDSQVRIKEMKANAVSTLARLK